MSASEFSVESTLRAHAPHAPEGLRARVLTPRPAPVVRLGLPPRRLMLVALPAALGLAVTAALVSGIVRSGDHPSAVQRGSSRRCNRHGHARAPYPFVRRRRVPPRRSTSCGQPRRRASRRHGSRTPTRRSGSASATRTPSPPRRRRRRGSRRRSAATQSRSTTGRRRTAAAPRTSSCASRRRT